MKPAKLIELNEKLGDFLDCIAPEITEESVFELRCNSKIASILTKVKKDYSNLSRFEIVEEEDLDANIELAHYDLYYDTDLSSETIKL